MDHPFLQFRSNPQRYLPPKSDSRWRQLQSSTEHRRAPDHDHRQAELTGFQIAMLFGSTVTSQTISRQPVANQLFGQTTYPVLHYR